MFLTNIKVYLKFLARNRVYTAINLIGFSLALAFVVLLGLYVADENRADRFHAKGARIYKLLNDERGSNWAAKLGPEIAERYPEIESYVRYSDDFFVVNKEGGEKVRALTLIVDSTFFDVFSYPLLTGDRARQIRTSGDVTLSEEFARKIFGDEDPMGQSLEIGGKPHVVTGIVSKFPKSHIQTPEMIVRFDDVHIGSWYFKGYNASAFPLYFVAREGSDLTSRGDDMAEWFKSFYWIYKNGMNSKVHFEPITDSYFNTHDGNAQYLYHANSRTFIALLAAAVLAILLFAVINYINLSVAQGGFRAREAAMRRLLGASRRGLLATYIFESVLFCAGALVLGVVVAAVLEPTFNRVMESSISIAGALRDPFIVAGAVASVMALGIVTGIWPALVITRVEPLEVVKGTFSRRTRMVYSKVFIAVQLCLTIVLVGCALTIERQTRFMRTADLGFDKQNLMWFENTVGNDRATGGAKMAGLRDRLMQVPGVEMVSLTAGTPVNGGNNNTNTYDDGTVIGFQVFLGDSLLFDILDLEIVERSGNSADTALWVNQTAARMLDLAPDARSFKFNGEEVALAGVVRDFHIRDLGTEIKPMVLSSARELKDWPWDILVKTSAGNPAETYRQVKEAYLDYNGGYPFDSGFVDASIDSWYSEQRRTGMLIGGFSVIAIVISVMGLVAMATYFMRQRRRDIAVRRVFGASEGQVLWRLVGSFMKLVAVAFVVAVPVVWWIMHRWLGGFAYRIPLGWGIFAVAGLAVAAVVFASIWWQSRTAARQNPIQALNRE